MAATMAQAATEVRCSCGALFGRRCGDVLVVEARHTYMVTRAIVSLKCGKCGKSDFLDLTK